jgi:hypothetical protein
VTASVRIGGAVHLAAAQKRLEKALVSLEKRYPATPAGLGVTVAWGLPYFRRLVPKLADGRRFPVYLPADVQLSKARRKRVSAVLDAMRFASDDPAVVLGADDVAFLFRSDDQRHLDDAYRTLLAAFADVFDVRSVRNGFVGGGFDAGPGLAKQMGMAAGVPGADLIVDGVQMFLGFTSTQKAAMAPDRIASFETLRRLTDQTPRSYWSGGTAMHLSHLDEDLEAWWKNTPFPDQLSAMTRPGLSVPDKTYTIAEDLSQIERPADVHTDLAKFGGVGHSATIQTVTRLQADTQDVYGKLRPRGTAIVGRADFNTLDNAFAQSALPAEVSAVPRAGVHFIAFAPTSNLFNRARRAMDGQLGDGSSLGVDARSPAVGFNSFVQATHRQNFVVPPRAHRAFPLVELLTPHA